MDLISHSHFSLPYTNGSNFSSHTCTQAACRELDAIAELMSQNQEDEEKH